MDIVAQEKEKNKRYLPHTRAIALKVLMRKEGSIIAIDGKTVRGNEDKSHKAYHVVSAFAAENELTLGEVTTEEKWKGLRSVGMVKASIIRSKKYPQKSDISSHPWTI